MADIGVVAPGGRPELTPYNAPYAMSSCDLLNEISWPGRLGLWIITADLSQKTEIAWDEDHGEEVIYVRTGSVSVNDVACPQGSAVGLEARAGVRLRATDHSQIVHFGQSGAGPPIPTGSPESGVHIVGPGPRSCQTTNIGGCQLVTGYFLDSTCPTCSITLFRVVGDGSYAGASHSHSQDELIHVLKGELRVGPLRVGPDSTIGVPHDRRYSFRTSEPFEFLNYRPGLSTHVSRERGSRLETAAGAQPTGVRNIRI
jgi:hypothetical protein